MPLDDIETAERDIDLAERGKKSLHQFISRRLSINCSRNHRFIQDFIVSDDLFVVIDSYGDIVDVHFLIYDCNTTFPDSE